jgi:hypothetical protein
VLASLAVGLLSASAVAEAGAPRSYRRSLMRIDAQLRLAIETRPAELGEYMRSSEIICGLAERAEASGGQQSESDWSTLSQAVRELDGPAAQAVDEAFARADAGLVALNGRFSARWRGQPARLRELARGVKQARRGIRSLRAAMSTISAALANWDERRCAAAHQGIEAGVRRISPGVDQVNRGMLRLVRLAAG